MCLLLNLISDIERYKVAIFGSLSALQTTSSVVKPTQSRRGFGSQGSINMSASYPKPPAGELLSAEWLRLRLMGQPTGSD